MVEAVDSHPYVVGLSAESDRIKKVLREKDEYLKRTYPKEYAEAELKAER